MLLNIKQANKRNDSAKKNKLFLFVEESSYYVVNMDKIRVYVG